MPNNPNVADEWRAFATAVVSAIINCNIANTTDEDSVGVLQDAALALLTTRPAPQDDAVVLGDAFLCYAFGETDRPVAAIVADDIGVQDFIIREWLGDADAIDGNHERMLPGIMEEFHGHDWSEPLEWTFEIGGVRIERVTSPAPQDDVRVLVPREPTQAMMDAAAPAFEQINAWCAEMQTVRGRVANWSHDDPPLKQAWRAMVNAALATHAASAPLSMRGRGIYERSKTVQCGEGGGGPIWLVDGRACQVTRDSTT